MTGNVIYCLKDRQEACSQPQCACLPRLGFLHWFRCIGFKHCFQHLGKEGRRCCEEWHVCLCETSVQILQKLKAFMSENGHEPESGPDSFITARIFHEIINWESSEGCKQACPAQAKELAAYAARFRPGYGCFCGPSEKTWTCNEVQPSHQFADG